MEWRKLGRLDCGNGESIVIYMSNDDRWKIESRRERIPHSNRSGYWYKTWYYLINTETRHEKQYCRLIDAQKAAEEELK